MNRGGVGARSLNIELQAALNPAGDRKVERFSWTFAPGDKVMQIENDYDKEVYISDLPQGLTFVTPLPARLLGRTFPQARHPRRLLQSIARRRPAAIRTVQSELRSSSAIRAFREFILGPQRRYQRDRVFRGRHARRFANHPILNRKPPTQSRKIYR